MRIYGENGQTVPLRYGMAFSITGDAWLLVQETWTFILNLNLTVILHSTALQLKVPNVYKKLPQKMEEIALEILYENIFFCLQFP